MFLPTADIENDVSGQGHLLPVGPYIWHVSTKRLMTYFNFLVKPSLGYQTVKACFNSYRKSKQFEIFNPAKQFINSVHSGLKSLDHWS